MKTIIIKVTVFLIFTSISIIAYLLNTYHSSYSVGVAFKALPKNPEINSLVLHLDESEWRVTGLLRSSFENSGSYVLVLDGVNVPRNAFDSDYNLKSDFKLKLINLISRNAKIDASDIRLDVGI
jgi:hypothetical protein